MNAVSFAVIRGGRRGVTWPPMQPPGWCQPQPVSDVTLSDFASLLILASAEAGAGKAAELDGELLACCQDAAEADWAADRAMDGVETIPFDEPAMDRILGAAVPFLLEYDAAIARATELPARTPEGLRAKAGLLLRHVASGMGCADLATSLARDVAGRD